MKSLAGVLALSAALGHPAAFAQSVDSFCASVSQAVNALAPTTKTLCVPTAKQAVLVMSQTPVFDHPGKRKAFVLLSCAAAGKELNEFPAIKIKELWLGDSNSAKTNQANVLKASDCRAAQREMHAGRITPEEAFLRIEKLIEVRSLK